MPPGDLKFLRIVAQCVEHLDTTEAAWRDYLGIRAMSRKLTRKTL